MVDSDPTRRQVSIGLGTALSAALAGCMGDEDDGNGDENGNGENGNGENGNGENGNGNETENGNGNETENGNGNGTPDPEGSAMLGILPENEDGERVTIGFDLTLQHADYADQSFERSYVGDWDEVVPYGEYTTTELATEMEWGWDRLPAHPFQIYYTGDWNVTIEANEAGDFETVEETIEITEEELTDTGSEELMREVSIVVEGAKSDAQRAQENAVVMEGQYRFDANHAPDTEWGWGVPNGSEETGTSVQQLAWEEGDNQRWDVEPVDEDGKWHRIVATHTDEDLVWHLDVDTDKQDWGDWDVAGAVVIDQWEESDEQLWRITPLGEDHPEVEEGDEFYKIENKATGGSAAVSNEGEGEGTDVYTWWYPGDLWHQVAFHEQ